MTIAAVLGTPYLTPLDAEVYFTHSKHLSYLSILGRHVRVVNRGAPNLCNGTHLAVAGSPADAVRAYPKLLAAPKRFTLLISGSLHALEELNVAALPNAVWSDAFLTDVTTTRSVQTPDLGQKRCLLTEARTLPVFKASAVIHALLPLFYRVEKDKRKELQRSVWAYLAGDTAKPPVTNVPRMQAIIESEDATLLRTAAVFAKTHSQIETLETFTDVDEYALNYLSFTGKARDVSKGRRKKEDHAV